VAADHDLTDIPSCDVCLDRSLEDPHHEHLREAVQQSAGSAAPPDTQIRTDDVTATSAPACSIAMYILGTPSNTVTRSRPITCIAVTASNRGTSVRLAPAATTMSELADDFSLAVSAWEVAKLLGMPYEGVFVVIVVEASGERRAPLTDLDRHLRTRGIAAAWRSQPAHLETTRRFVVRVLGKALALPKDDRATLMATAEAWIAARGSAAEAGRVLYCHENTVRHRLHRLEGHLGVALDDPRNLADLTTALEAIRTFPQLGTRIA
jgi:hypothetical protein